MSRVFFTVADKNNEKWANDMIRSLKKFHPDEEVILYGQKELDELRYDEINEFFYKSTPFFTKELIKKYDTVIQINADSIVTGKLDHILNDTSYDVGVVLNNNRIDRYTIWDIPANMYYNCGFVVMRNREFVEHWWKLCNSYHFPNTMFREQGLLNILCHYGNYNVKCLDDKKFANGLIIKSEWGRLEMRDGKLICPALKEYNADDWEVSIIHVAGGNNPNKMDIFNKFSDEVSNYLKQCIS